MRILLATLVSLCTIYVADALVFRLAHQPFGEVQVRRYYAMPLKGGKTEYGDAGVEKDTCVHALFPHSGYPPCWYASRKRERWVTE
jgi:hypothetical protein